MPRPKKDEQHIRKLQRTGQDGASYSLTIPKHLIDELGWRERQKLVVERKGITLVIKDWKK